MTKEQKFYSALRDIFIGAKIEGKGGFVNLMRIKSNYYRKIEELLKDDIEKALEKYPSFRDELFDKLYSFFSRYFTESGSIYFNSTPFHNNIYEKVYTDEKDVILFWKTQMLYYVKTDRIFRSMPVEFPSERGVDAKGGRSVNSPLQKGCPQGTGYSPLQKGCPEGTGYLKFYFDASKIESKKANEKRSLVFELKNTPSSNDDTPLQEGNVSEDQAIVFNVSYSERGTKTKTDEILKAIKKKGIAITEEQLERAFMVFEKQSEVDFFINKNAKAFLQEQFKLWSYQYFWEGIPRQTSFATPLQEGNAWSADRVNQLQILKDIAFKIIDFISQFEDELVKIWNKPKFVKNSNYVITLDRIANTPSCGHPSERGEYTPSCGHPSERGEYTPSCGHPSIRGELIEKILKHKNIKEQIKEWQVLGIVDENFKIDDVFENSPSGKGWQEFPSLRGDKGVFPARVVKWNELPFNPKLKERAKELRKAGNLSEVLLWNQIKNKQFKGLDFDRQKIIGNYIVDFYCKDLGVIIEIDGVSHDGKVEYDKQRDDYLKSLGLRVIHILDSDVKNNLSGVMEFLERELEHPVPSGHPSIRGEYTPSCGHPSIRGEYKHLPIDTKYFKDLELEILSLFDDLDNSLDGWLIKSENYQALNTILPKFKEKVQTIYIDPPFNLDSSDQFLYRTNYKDANWATLLENRLRIAKDWLNEKGSIFVRCDYNGNWIVRCLMDEIFGEENFRNEIVVARGASKAGLFTQFDGVKSLAISYDNFYWYSKNENLRFKPFVKEASIEQKTKGKWTGFDKGEAYDRPTMRYEILGVTINKGQWKWSKERAYQAVENYKKYIKEYSSKMTLEEYWDKTDRKLEFIRKNENGKIQYWVEPRDFVYVDNNWLDITGYSSTTGFQTENSEFPIKRIIETLSDKNDLIIDFFLGSGTTTAVHTNSVENGLVLKWESIFIL